MEQQDPTLLSIQRSMDRNFEQLSVRLGASSPVARTLGQGAHRMSLDPTSVHVNQPLANVLVFFKNNTAIADDVMPVVQVSKMSDVYYVFAADTAFDTAKTDVAGQMGQVAEVSLAISNTAYGVTNHSLREWIPVQTIENADAPLSPLGQSVDNLRRYLDLAREVRVAAGVFNTGNYGSNTQALTGSSRWDTTTGNPVTDHFTAIQSMLLQDELVGVYGHQVWNAMINNPSVKSFFTGRPSTELGATPMMMNPDTWRNSFGMRKAVVGKMRSNSVNDPSTPSYGFVWGKYAAILHVPESPGIMKAAFAYTFRWRPFTHRIHFNAERGVEGAYMAQVHHADAEQIIDSNGLTGYLFSTAIS